MAFPSPSETFACNDVLALKRTGLEVSVHSLKRKHSRFSQLVLERKLADVWMTHNSLLESSMQGLWIGITHPKLFAEFIVWIIRHAWKNPIVLLKSLLFVPRSLQIYVWAKQQSPDVIYLYWSHFPSLVGYLIQKKLPKISVSISFVAYDLYEPEFAPDRFYSDDVAQKADVIQTIAKANVPAVSQYGGSEKDVVVAYHGIDFSKIPSKREKIKYRIVTAGRLVPEKGFSAVLKIFSKVLKDWPDSSLVLLGDGPERQNLEALSQRLNINHAVEFRGFVSHDAIFEEMAVAEIFLFMSEVERLPNVVKEAIACDCLCVVSHTFGIEELIVDQVSGYVVRQDDIDGAYAKICYSFSNPLEMKKTVQLAEQQLRENFDIDVIANRLKETWEGIP